MTSERRLLIGFDDVRAVTLECKRCGARLTIAPAKLTPDDFPVCPSCRAAWVPRGISASQHSGASISQFLQLLPELMRSAGPDADTNIGVRVLLELAEPT